MWRHNLVNKQLQYTTTTTRSVFVRILSSQAISFQILLYALFPRLPWSTLLPFPSYFNFHNLAYLGIDVSTHGMTIPPKTALIYHILNLQNNTHFITKNISRHLSTNLTPHILIIQSSTPRNLVSSATVSCHISQKYNKTGLTQH